MARCRITPKALMILTHSLHSQVSERPLWSNMEMTNTTKMNQSLEVSNHLKMTLSIPFEPWTVFKRIQVKLQYRHQTYLIDSNSVCINNLSQICPNLKSKTKVFTSGKEKITTTIRQWLRPLAYCLLKFQIIRLQTVTKDPEQKCSGMYPTSSKDIFII